MATATTAISGFVRSDLTEETKVYPIPFTSCRRALAMDLNLPDTPTSVIAALVTGAPGTNAPTIQGFDPGGTTAASLFAFEFAIPPEYVAGAAAAIRVRGKTGTSIADVSCTVDFNVYLDSRDGTVAADIMASGAFNINNTTAVTSDMTISPSTLEPGKKLIVVGTIAGEDAGNAAAIVPTILALEMVLNVKG